MSFTDQKTIRFSRNIALTFLLSALTLPLIDAQFSTLVAASASEKEKEDAAPAHARIHRHSTRTSYAVGKTVLHLANANDAQTEESLRQRHLQQEDGEFNPIPFYLEPMLQFVEGDLRTDLEEGLKGNPFMFLQQFKEEVNGIFDLMAKNDPGFTLELKKILYAAQLGGYGTPEKALQLVGSLAYRINDDGTTTLIDKKAARIYVRGINKQRAFLNNPNHIEMVSRICKAGYAPAITLWHDHQEQLKKELQSNPLLANLLDPTTVADILEGPDLSKETTKDGIPITPSMRISAIIETLPEVEYDNTILFPALLDADNSIIEQLAFNPLPLKEKLEHILDNLPDRAAHDFIARTLVFPVPNNHASKHKETLLALLYERNIVPIEIKSTLGILQHLSDNIGEAHHDIYSAAMIECASGDQNELSSLDEERLDFAFQYLSLLDKNSSTESEQNQLPDAISTFKETDKAQAARNVLASKLTSGIEGRTVTSALVAVADYFNCRGDNFERNIANALLEVSMRAHDWTQFNELIQNAVIPSFGDVDGLQEALKEVNHRLGIELALRRMDLPTTAHYLLGDALSPIAKMLAHFKKIDTVIQSSDGSSALLFESLFSLVNARKLPAFSLESHIAQLKEEHHESTHRDLIDTVALDLNQNLSTQESQELMHTLLGDNEHFFYQLIALIDEMHYEGNGHQQSTHSLLKSIFEGTLKAKSATERQILADAIINSWVMGTPLLGEDQGSTPIPPSLNNLDVDRIQRIKILNDITSQASHDFGAPTWTSQRRYDILLSLCHPDIPSANIDNHAQTVMAHALKGALMAHWNVEEDDDQKSMQHAVHFGMLNMKEAELWNSLLGLANTNQRAQEAVVELLRLQSKAPKDQYDEFAKFLGYYYTLLQIN